MLRRLLCLVALTAMGSACAVYPPDRDTTQPNKIKKSLLVCGNSEEAWPDCGRGSRGAEWYFRPTVTEAPYEAWWTFEGEQGDTYKIVWEVSETMLVAYRVHEGFKGSAGDKVDDPNWRGEPIAAWNISSHFDVWHQYNAATGEQLPVLYEAQERPWFEREYIRVDWSKNLISGYGFFMGSKLNIILGGGAIVAEPAVYAVTDPSDPDHLVVTDSYLEVSSRETHTPMTVSGMDGGYFSTQPTSEVTYRYSFMKADKRDYQPLYYPDPMFWKDGHGFGFFRTEREVYDRERGPTDFKDYLANRFNLWKKTHSDKSCTKHSDCGGGAEEGVTCNLFEKGENGAGLCTLPYAERGLKSIEFWLSPNYPEDRYGHVTCMVGKGWDAAFKQSVAPLLGISYSPPSEEEMLAECDLGSFTPVPDSGEADFSQHDLFVFKRNEKTCDVHGNKGQGDRWCARMGDLRYNMLYYVDQASAGSPLGYGPSAKDPFTGEIVQANSFMYGGAMDTYRALIKDIWDIVSAEGPDADRVIEWVRTGENVREYYQNQSGNSFPRTVPQTGFTTDPNKMESLRMRLGHVKENMEQLNQLAPGARSPTQRGLEHTWIERMLVDNIEWKAAHGLGLDGSLTDEQMDAFSPFRSNFKERLHTQQRVEGLFSRSEHCAFHPNEYTDASVSWLVERYKHLGRDEAINRIVEMIYRGVTEHELGHNFGLRHNFEGSYDSHNYFPEYYAIRDQYPDPVPQDFGTLPLSPDEFEAYDAALRENRVVRDAAGIKMFQYSSIMDYGGQFYSDLRGLGKYDIAAVKFGYGGLAEVFDGSPNATRTNRLDKVWYPGGEACESDNQCPFAGAGQTCRTSSKRCTSWEDDAALQSHVNPVVRYRFCSDERVGDRPFCNRWDEGASSTEIVENLIDSYDRNYIFNNFRRYRRFFGPAYAQRIWTRYYEMMGKQFASALYQLYYDRENLRSFEEVLAGSVKAMNFFTRVLTTPDVGAYRRVELEEVDLGGGQSHQRHIYERYNADCNAGRGNPGVLNACLGIAKHFWSVWEDGYYGAIDRQARAGIFIDKLYAILALTNRDWSQAQGNDEIWPLSFYDGFQGEMLNLFSGIISNDIKRYAPVIAYDDENKPFVRYRDVWSGSFFGSDASSFLQNPVVRYPGSAELDTRYDLDDLLDPAGRSPYIRFYALVLSLQSWPSIFDQNYADYLQLYTFGGPEVRFPADGVETVAYESPRRKKIFMAVQTPDDKSIIYPLVKQASDIKVVYDQYYSMSPQQARDGELLDQTTNEQVSRHCRWVGNDEADKHEVCRRAIVDGLGRELDDRESFLNIAYEVRKLLGLAI